MIENDISVQQMPAGQLFRLRLTAFCVAIGAGLVYWATVCPTAFPGQSARAIALLSGLDVRSSFERPVLYALGQFFAELPLQIGLVARFNLLAVIMGAILVGLLFRITWFLVDAFMCKEESSILLAPKVAGFAAWVTAICAATALPVWSAATRFTFVTVDATLFFMSAYLIVIYTYRFRWPWMTLFAIIYGVAMAESIIFLVAFPVLFGLWLMVEWRETGEVLRPRVWLNCLLGAFVFFSDYLLSFRQAVVFSGQPLSSDMFITTLVSIFRGYSQDLWAFLPNSNWIWVLATGLVLFVFIVFTSMAVLLNRRSLSLLFLLATLSALSGYALFQLKGTAWAVWAPRDEIPLFTVLFGCLGMGLVLACWRALMDLAAPMELKDVRRDDDSEEEGQVEPSDATVVEAGRSWARVFCPLLVVVIGVACYSNIRRFDRSEGSFGDFIAREILSRLGERRWLVANDILDANLLLCAKQQGKEIVLFQPYRAGDRNYRLQMKRILEKEMDENLWLRANTLLDRSFLLFMEELFMNLPEMHRKAISLSFSDLWYSGKYQPIPEGFFFGGRVAGGDGKPDAATLKRDEQLWLVLADQTGLAAQNDGKGLLVSAYRDATWRQLSLLINNTGVQMDDLGKPEEAFRLYQLARRFNPDNVSALLNLFELVTLRGLHPESKEQIVREMEEVVNDHSMRHPIWALSRYYGYVRNYELFLAKGLTWVASSCPDSVLATLRNAQSRSITSEEAQRSLLSAIASLHAIKGDYAASRKSYEQMLVSNPRNVEAISGLSRLMLQQGFLREAQTWLETGESAGIPRQALRSDWAVYYLASGDYSKARLLMDDPSVTSGKPALLALLGIIMLEQNEVAQVENVILPKLTKQAHGADQYYVQILQGRLFQMKGNAFANKARACYLRAAVLRPDVEGLVEVVLGLDATLGDAGAAELHAIQLLRRQPGHPYANYILGTFRLQKGLYADAERYLSKSIAVEKPSFAALNNYAETAVRLGLFEKAETCARQAIAMRPDAYEGWALLADVQVRVNKGDEAEQSLLKARKIYADEPRFAFVEARIAILRQDAAGAVAALKKLGALQLTPIEQKDLEGLQKQTGALSSEK